MDIVTIEPAELVPALARQTATATIVAGTGAVAVPIAELRKLLDSPAQFADFVEALVEEENLYAMATLDTAATGIFNTLYMIPASEGPHGPRIKVMLDPPRAKRRGGLEATVPFDAPGVGPLPPALERQVRDFIQLNRPVLEEYWRVEITTAQFIRTLRPIPPK